MKRRVARGILLKGEKALLVKRSRACKHHPGWWQFPGGKGEGKEPLRATVVREVREETGLRFTPGTRFRPGEGKLFFLGEWRGALRLARKEIAETRWVSYAEAMQLPITPMSRRMFKLLRERKIL